MPGRNIIKIDTSETFYHAYSRGVNKQKIFLEDEDFQYFLALFSRHLSDQDDRDGRGVRYEKLYDEVEVLAYCLMGNHFHLLFYQIEEKGMSRLMHSVLTAYSAWFNKKYNRRGPLFESRYRASRVDNDTYLMHISRYIHLNPDRWREYPYSSVKNYLGVGSTVDWLNASRILELFPTSQKYEEFLSDYKDIHDELEKIKDDLKDY